jgi:uncharacterized protein YndB with AHSA1/START domain
MMPTEPQARAPELEILTARAFAAPRDVVFRAWTEPEHLKHWWGPKGFSCTFHSFDFKVGGEWHFTMHGPDGTDYDNRWMFLEITRPARLVMDHLSPPRFRIIATFDELPERRTQVRMRQVFESAAECARVRVYAEPANVQLFDKLEVVLAQLT